MTTPPPSAEQIAALVAQLRKYGGAVRIGGKPLTSFILEAANALESLQLDRDKLAEKLVEAEKALDRMKCCRLLADDWHRGVPSYCCAKIAERTLAKLKE